MRERWRSINVMGPRITWTCFTRKDDLRGILVSPGFRSFCHVRPSDTPLCETFCIDCWHPYSCDSIPSCRTCILGPEGVPWASRGSSHSPGLPWYVTFVSLILVSHWQLCTKVFPILSRGEGHLWRTAGPFGPLLGSADPKVGFYVTHTALAHGGMQVIAELRHWGSNGTPSGTADQGFWRT